MAGLNADQSLLRVGLALQKYRLHNPETDIPVPRYVIMGLQSAGKTRLLSVLARAKVGGAEKANCGTRCPVEYTFEPGEPDSQPEFRFGSSVSNLTAGSEGDVAAFVTNHMDGLAAEEERKRQGFSKQPIFVQVKSPNATPLVVADCPGLQGQEESANNACITAIYRSQLEAPNSTAVIVSALPATLDIQQITKELGDFVRGANLLNEHYWHALLLVNRLDAVKSSLDASDAPLVEFQKQADQRYGLAKQRMAFMCLVPEVLGNTYSIPILKNSTPVEEQNVYFKEKMWELEKEALQHFSQVHLGLEQPPRNVGVHACIDLVCCDLKGKIMEGWDRMLERLHAEWTDTLEPQLNSMLDSTEVDDDEELEQELTQYLGIVCEGLAGLQAHDLSRRLESSVGKVNWEWVVEVHAACARHVKSAGKTYMTECEEQTGSKGNAALDEVLLHPKTRRELVNAKDHPVAESMHFPYFGEAALRRLVTMQRFAWMREPLREFTEAEIWSMGGFIDGEDVRGPGLSAIVRKAVASAHASSAKDIGRFMQMVKRCLESLCYHVRSILKESVPMLQETPKLRGFIDEECVERHYVQLIGKFCKDAEENMQELLKARFSSLSLDEPLNLVRILMCSGFDLTMLDPPSRFRDSACNGGRQPMNEGKVKEILGRFASLALPGEVQQLAETLVSTLLSSSGNTETDEGFFKAIAAAANALGSEGEEDPALTLALNDRLNVTNIPLREFKTQLGKINSTIHAFVRFCRGMALMDVQMVLEKDVIIEARQLRNTMTLRMKEISDHLFSHESQELLEHLKAPSDVPLDESKKLKERLAAYLDTLMKLREVPNMSVQLDFVCQILPSRLQQFEKYVAAEEKRAGNDHRATERRRNEEAVLKKAFFDRLALGKRRSCKRAGYEVTVDAKVERKVKGLTEENRYLWECIRERERKLAAAERRLGSEWFPSESSGDGGRSAATHEAEAKATQRLQAAEQRIALLEIELDTKQRELGDVLRKLGDTQRELGDTQRELEELKVKDTKEVGDVQRKPGDTQRELGDTPGKLQELIVKKLPSPFAPRSGPSLWDLGLQQSGNSAGVGANAACAPKKVLNTREGWG